MDNHLDQVVQRTRQYWFVDGIVELTVGVVFFILGLYFYLQSILTAGSWLLTILQVGFVFLLVGLIYLNRLLVSKIKSKLTTPRTGYVSYKRASQRQRLVSMGIVGLIALINVLLFFFTPLSSNWVPAISGLIVGSLWLISAFRVGLLRFYLLAILTYLLGAILLWAGMELYQSLALFYGILGVILILSGSFTLVRYLRRNPTPDENQPL